jgi:hypothetical protein
MSMRSDDVDDDDNNAPPPSAEDVVAAAVAAVACWRLLARFTREEVEVDGDGDE